MAMKLSEKQIRDGYKKIVKIGYCELDEILAWIERNGFTAGVYGWNADVYTIGTTAIVTGYRPIGKRPAAAEIETTLKMFNEYKSRCYDPGLVTLKDFQAYIYNLLYKIEIQ